MSCKHLMMPFWKRFHDGVAHQLMTHRKSKKVYAFSDHKEPPEAAAWSSDDTFVHTCNCKLPAQLGTSAYPYDGVAHKLTHM